MTNQEAFTRVVQHLRSQGRKSMGSMGCQYRGDNGTRCAVGVLITDEFYDSRIEGSGVIGTLSSKVDSVIEKALPGINLELLVYLQTTHDLLKVDDWEQEWRRIAVKFDLVVPPRDEFPRNEEAKYASDGNETGRQEEGCNMPPNCWASVQLEDHCCGMVSQEV